MHAVQSQQLPGYYTHADMCAMLVGVLCCMMAAAGGSCDSHLLLYISIPACIATRLYTLRKGMYFFTKVLQGRGMLLQDQLLCGMDHLYLLVTATTATDMHCAGTLGISVAALCMHNAAAMWGMSTMVHCQSAAADAGQVKPTELQ